MAKALGHDARIDQYLSTCVSRLIASGQPTGSADPKAVQVVNRVAPMLGRKRSITAICGMAAANPEPGADRVRQGWMAW